MNTIVHTKAQGQRADIGQCFCPITAQEWGPDMNQCRSTMKGICKISIYDVIDHDDLNSVSIFGVGQFQSLHLGQTNGTSNHQVSEHMHHMESRIVTLEPCIPVSIVQT